MKNKLLLLLLLLPAWGARAQTTLAQESFESDGNGVRYTSNTFDLRTSAASVAGAFPYFTRALTNPLVNPLNPAYVSFGSNAYPVTIGNVTGSVFWAAEAVESTATNPASTDRPPGVVTLNAINASNYSGLTMTVALGDARGPSSPIITQGSTNPQNEANDFIRLQYSVDGGASYNTIGQFVGNNSTGTGQGYLQLDVDKDGEITSADGAQSATNTLDINLRDFSFSIPGSPGALLVRVQIDQRGASEELAFDNIRVTGVANTVAPPVLANIEGTAVSYLEGQAATQLTSSLTVSNAAGNLTEATVTISSGRASTQDVLSLPTTAGISSIYNSSTGVLTLTGSASAAAYQAALRTVTYQNSNSANATAGTRTIQFVVANGSATSGAASRNVVVTAALNAATALPYREDFTNDGEGTRYASNTFTNSGTGAAWLRTSTNPYQTAATSQTPTTFSGISNSTYWYGNNTNSVVNPSRIGTLQTLPINTAGYAGLNFSLLLGASSGTNASWQTADYFQVSYRQVGTSTWVPLLQFRGNSAVVAGQGNMQRDADPNAAAGSAAPTGPTLTPALTLFSAALPSSADGQTLEFQVVQVSDDIRAELAFDNLQLTGTQVAAPTVAIATATSITSTSAVLGGSVTADGGAAVTARGIRYGTSSTLSGATQVANGSGTGTFSTTISGLAPGTTYYVAAYATNSVGTTQGPILTFNTAAPTITLAPASPLASATVGVAYSQPITASGGTAPYSFAITTGALPAGLTLASSGTLAGTPTASGSFSFTVRATDASAGTYSGTQSYSLTVSPPTIVVGPASLPIGTQAVAYSQTITASGGTAPYTFAITSGALPSGLTLASSGTLAGTPTASGSFTFTVAATDASAGGPYSGSRSYTLTIAAPAATTAALTQVTPSPTATATVTYRATFAAGVSGLSTSNFSVTNAGTTVAGASVTSVVALSTTAYNVVVSTGTSNGTLVLQLVNSTGVTPAISNLPANGPSYSITRSFAAQPQLTIVGTGGAGSDVTAFVDQVQVLNGGAAFANGLQNSSFETHAPLANGNYGYQPTGASWTFNTQAGIAESGSAFTPVVPIPNGIAVAFVQTLNGNNGQLQQNLAVPTGSSYQVSFQAAQRVCCNTLDQALNVFLNGVYLGTIQPVDGSGYSTFTSPTFAVTAPALTATVSTTSASPTGVAPIPFAVTFSQSVGTTFTVADVTVTGGTLTSGSFSGSGPYTFTVTPSASGTVSVSLAAGVATDANNTGNTASNTLSVQYQQPATAAPALSTPANGTTTNGLPTYAGTAPAGSTVTLYLTPNGGTAQAIGTTTATGGSFSLTPATALVSGTYSVYATAQSNGATVSANSNTSTFTVDATAPTVVSILRQNPAATLTNASSLTYRLTFSEAVTGVSTSDFSLTSTGTAAGTIAAVAAVSTSVYDVTVASASGDGTLRLDLNNTGTGIADLASNALAGGYTSGQAYTLDQTAPIATISTTATNPTSTSPIPFTVTFSEAVTGFSASGVTVTNGTITTAITNVGNAYSFSITPTANGAVTVSVVANAAQDAAGNGNPAAGPVSITYVAPVTLTTWMGAISTDWFTAGNWTAGVPTATLDAVVPVVSTNRYPLIAAGTASVRSLTLDPGASLSQGGGTIQLRGNLTNNGTFTATAGTVATTATTAQTLGGSSPLAFQGLNIGAAGATLATSASFQRILTLTGNLTTNGQSLTLLSRILNSGGTNVTQDGLVVNNGGVVVGTVTVQRAIDPSLNPGLGYRHYASPVSNATVVDLTTSGFTPVVNPAFNTDATPYAVTPFPTVYGYDNSRLSLANNMIDFDKGFFSPAALSDALAVGQGYTVNIGASEVVDFQGTLNTGDRTLNLTSTRASYPDGGWQLLGNPYPAPLDYSRIVVGDRVGLDAAIYIYSSLSQYGGSYRTYVNGVGNPVLPIGQGFFARVAAGQPTASLTFRNTQRLTLPNGTNMQRTAETRPLVQLTLQGSTSALLDEASVYFENGATSGFEPEFDAEKLANPSGLNLSTSLANGQQLSIDGQPELGTSQRVVPLAVGVPAVGSYTFTASQLLNLSAVPVYLRDVQTGALIDLAQQPSYQFSVTNASVLITGRFELVFSPQQPLATVPAALAQQVGVYPNPAKPAASVTIALPVALARQVVKADLVDVLGRVVRSQQLPASVATHTMPLGDIATGMYSLRLTTSAGVLVKKLVLE